MMMTRREALASMTAAGALALIGSPALALAPPRGANLTPASRGAAVAPLPLLTQRGEARTLLDYRGRAVIAVLWQEHCPGCRIELPKLEAARDGLRAVGAEVAPLCLDTNFQQSYAWMKRAHPGLTPVQDVGRLNATHLVRSVFGGNRLATPMSFLIDARGGVAAGAFGFVDWDRADVRGYLGALASA